MAVDKPISEFDQRIYDIETHVYRVRNVARGLKELCEFRQGGDGNVADWHVPEHLASIVDEELSKLLEEVSELTMAPDQSAA